MRMTNMPLPSGDDLGAYLDQVRRYPLLDPETEAALARRWREDGDEDAAHRLAESYLRLVVKIARGYLGYRVAFEDLIAEGNVGLLQAIERFEPERGFRLSTYAAWWIRAAIQDFVMRSESLVRMGTTADQKKLFFGLRRLKARAGELGDGDLAPETVAQIAATLGVPEAEVVEMNRRLAGGAASLDAAAYGDPDSDSTFLDLMVDETDNQEERLGESETLAVRRDLLKDALEELNPRERHILTERRLKEDPPTLEELSKVYGVSRERIRQIEGAALEKLTRAMTAAAPADTLEPTTA